MKCFSQTVLFLVALGLNTGISAAPQQAQQGSYRQASEAEQTPVSIVQKRAADPMATAQSLFQVSHNARPRSLSPEGETVLVIPSPNMNPEDFAAITEDMNIMYRILMERRLQLQRLTSEDTVTWLEQYRDFHGRGTHSTGCIYLDGYGVIFFMHAPFPLSDPLKTQEQGKPDEETDPIWARVKEEIYDPGAAARRNDDQSGETFDPERVESLKRVFVKALIHAANIRALKPSDYITLMVSGSSPASQGMYLERYTLLLRDGKAPVPAPLGATDSVRSATLTIRTKKADVDSYFKNQLDFESFYKKADILTSHAHFRSSGRSRIRRAAQ